MLRKFEFTKKQWFWALIFFSFFEPDLFKNITYIHLVFNLARVLIFLGISFYYYRQKLRPSRLFMTILVFYGLLLLSTLLKKGDLLPFIGDGLPILAFLLVLELFIHLDLRKTLRAFISFFTFLILANLVFFIVFPQGYGAIIPLDPKLTRHFLGNRNQLITFFYPAMLVLFLDSYLDGVLLSRLGQALYLLMGLSLFLTGSATSGLGFLFFVLYIFFIYGRKWETYISFKLLLGLYIGLFIGLVVFRFHTVFNFIIRKVLKKTMTFSGRTKIWDKGLGLIKKAPIMGYGHISGGRYIVNTKGKLRDAHNLILQIVLRGGILGLGSFLLILKEGLSPLVKRDDSLAKFFMVSIFIFFLMAIMEVYNLKVTFMIFYLAYFIDIIDEVAGAEHD